MATAVFQDNSGDWDDSDNWTGGSGIGGVPDNDDTVVIASGTNDLDTNLDTGLTGITLRIGPGYSGTIGSSTAPLEIDGGEFSFRSAGTGGCFIEGDWTTVNVQGGASGDNMLNFNGSSNVDTLRVLGGSGTVTVQDGATLDDLLVSSAGGVTVTVEDGVTSLDTVVVESGAVTVNANIGTSAESRGGSLTIGESATCAALTIEPDGAVVYNSSGALTTLNGYGGIFDATENTSDSVTITTCTIYSGCTIDLRSGINNFTLTNGVAYYGGVFYPPIGSTLTLS